jgi:hypothetical protein
MTMMIRSVLLATALAGIFTGQALAYPRYDEVQDPPRLAEAYGAGAPNDVTFRVGLFGDLGYSTYALGDENQYIDQLNADSSRSGGKSINHITGGLTGGLGMTFGMAEFCQIGFEYEGLGAYTNGTLVLGESVTISLPASEFGGFLKLVAPVEDRWLLSFGLGLYNLWIDNDTEKFTLPDGTATSNTFYGSGLATKLWMGGEFFLTHHLSLGVDAGYRFARINDVTDQNGVAWFNSDGSKLTMDYSGPFARTALQFYF